MSELPDQAAFLSAPYEEIAAIAPATAIIALGGTRRSAELAGIDRSGPAYATWLRGNLTACCDLMFKHGIRNLIVPTSIAKHLAEADAGGFRKQFFKGIHWGYAGPEALADYQQHGWRVRLIGADNIPELTATADVLREQTPSSGTTTLWHYVSADRDAAINALISAALDAGAQTQRDAIRALYGEDIPLAALLIGFGKPTLGYDIFPPLLVGRLQCYWTQRPGYSLNESTLRRVLYDYAHTRRTGSGTERSDRYAGVEHQRSAWLTDWVLGVGESVGGFWYPSACDGVPKRGE
jgi:hypothetical protein